MRLLFKQRLFSWFDSYDIYDEAGNVVFTVKGQLSWGHKLVVYNAYGEEVGMVVERILTFLPKFEIIEKNGAEGFIRKEFSFFTPHYNIDYKGWHIDGDWLEWDYKITDRDCKPVAWITKEVFHLRDTYTIDVKDPKDALSALLFVLAIDAEKCSRN